MQKHGLTPPPSPPHKRVHYSHGLKAGEPSISRSFEALLYDELVLHIFSHLDYTDLCAVQATSRNWARIASDNELWRKLYLRVFGCSRLRGSKGFIGRVDGREVKPLPGGINTGSSRDWKFMFRISSNWRRGSQRAAFNLIWHTTVLLTPFTLLGRCSTKCKDNWGVAKIGCTQHQTHVLVAGSLVVVASAKASTSPNVTIFNAKRLHEVVSCTSQGEEEVRVTALAIDQSPPSHRRFRFSAFLSSGEINVFTVYLTHSNCHSKPIMLADGSSWQNEQTIPIVQAVYHHPLLISMSESLHLSFYYVKDHSIRHIQTMSSFTSFPPTSLVLSMTTPGFYKLVVAYAIPVYPAHWSVGATELTIAGAAKAAENPSTSILSSVYSLSPPDSMTIMATRTARSVDVPSGWIDSEKVRQMREQWARKVLRVSDMQTDGRWLVLAADEGHSVHQYGTLPFKNRGIGTFFSSATLQLYRLSFSPPSPAISAHPPKLVYVRNLHGQTGPIAALAVADGRCVSLGMNGGIWVWDLEIGTGAEVAPPDVGSTGGWNGLPSPKRSVVFDERRIITTSVDGVVIRRFDI